MPTERELQLKEKRRENGPWLDSFHDPVANITAYNDCVRLADVSGNGEYKLLVADGDRKLKVFKDTFLQSEHALLDMPSAMAVFYSDLSQPQRPSVAVACGSYIYIYRNMTPYFKFTLPALDLEAVELDIWNALRQGQATYETAVDVLRDARDSGVQLCFRSLDLLALDSPDAQMAFVEQYKALSLQQLTVVTCLDTLYKSVQGEKAVSCLIVGTESKHIIIMNPTGSSIMKKIQLPSVPSYIQCVGTYDVEYRIIVGCRDGRIYTIKRHQLTATVIEMETQPCGMCVIDTNKQILVAGMNNVIHSFHYKGKKSYSLYMPEKITTMALLHVSRISDQKALLVGLQNGEVRLYNKKNLVHTIKCNDVVTAIRFGPYGREDGALVMTHKSGALTVKYLQRQAKLDVASEKPGPPPEQDIPLNIPTRTKLYLEQTQREREQSVDMHRMFQRDLMKLKLNTSRAYVKTILSGDGPLSSLGGGSVSMECRVQGLGPLFKIMIEMKNSGDTAVLNLPLSFTYDHDIYEMKSSTMLISALVPGVRYHYEANITCIDADGQAAPVRTFLLNPSSSVPLVSAIVNMPTAEIAEE